MTSLDKKAAEVRELVKDQWRCREEERKAKEAYDAAKRATQEADERQRVAARDLDALVTEATHANAAEEAGV